jgi:hypothetical protein
VHFTSWGHKPQRYHTYNITTHHDLESQTSEGQQNNGRSHAPDVSAGNEKRQRPVQTSASKRKGVDSTKDRHKQRETCSDKKRSALKRKEKIQTLLRAVMRNVNT